GRLVDANGVNFNIHGGTDSVSINNYNGAVIIDATDYDWHGSDVKKTTYNTNETKDIVEGEWFKCEKVVHDEIFQYYKITVKPNTTGKNRKADINLKGTEPQTHSDGKRFYYEETLSIYQDAK
ncbi:MAG: hypothetical protein K5757_06030, partial [Bacteroidaceae bacterium]|nr:hypothetical protein [Bacteroidaceae bacterium]